MLRFRSSLLCACLLGVTWLTPACGGAVATDASRQVPVAGDLLPLLHADNPHLAHTSMLIAQTGDARVLAIASERLIAIAAWATGDPSLDEDRRMRLLSQTYAAMVALPTPPVVQHCRAVIHDPRTVAWQRIMASTVVLAESEGAPQGVPAAPSAPSQPVVTEPVGAVVLSRPDGIPPTAQTP